MKVKPTLEDFIKEWWSDHKNLRDTELGSNGQFDNIPYEEYENLYGEKQLDENKNTQVWCK